MCVCMYVCMYVYIMCIYICICVCANIKLSLENKNLKWGKYHYEIKKEILKYMLDTITGTPRNYYV